MNTAFAKTVALVALTVAGMQTALASTGLDAPNVPCTQENADDLYTVTTRLRPQNEIVTSTYQCVVDGSDGYWQLIMRCDKQGCVAY